ncbi:MAG: glutamate-5-semialdehyde dehydrogenase [Clostridia bacterium]|nr:glutamate-5-semialdehyde dehydrogenase [Clostridia bacterium]
MVIEAQVLAQGKKAKEAARVLAGISSGTKDRALHAMARALEEEKDRILAANAIDMAEGKDRGLSKAMLDRLMLNEARIEEMAAGLRAIAALADPVGEVTSMWTRPNGLQIGRVRVPLGVVGIIYESRPNVTADAAGLCVKTGNAVLMRGGAEAFNSNLAITEVISRAAEEAGIPTGAIQLVQVKDREAVNVMLKMNQYLDVLIPRGGAGLIQTVIENATVPVIETGVGNCHVYVDEDAEIDMALNIVVNAKTQRPGVCNAMETLLVHEKIAPRFLPLVAEKLSSLNVELRGCEKSRNIVPWMKEATEEDWATEYLDLILAVRVVDSFEQAVEHIHTYGTKHSEAIVTQNYRRAREFLRIVDAAAVYVNASTRFTDGFQYGLGAEIGISTQKLHARGPMGLEALTTIKYIVFGDGQVRT